MTVLASTRALLEHAVDYAGTFPPAALPLGEAALNYSRERNGPDAWLLGRLVVPAGSLDELESALTREGGNGHEVSVIASSRGGPLPRSGDDILLQLARVDAFNERQAGGARIVSVEFPPAPAVDISRLAGRVQKPLEAFFETPLDDDLETRLDAISKAGVNAKVRTGGIVPAAIPTPASLARFLHACAARRLAFKATAGLHHALRSCYSLTYERDSATAVMHGFLNVNVGAMLAQQGASAGDIAEVLDESSPTSFGFYPDRVVYKGMTTGLEDVALTRRFFRSFGSCSFREPVEELARLHLV